MKDWSSICARRKRRLESAADCPRPVAERRPAIAIAARSRMLLRCRCAAVLVGVALCALAGPAGAAAAATRSGKPAVAVLYFENNTGDPSLDWMRTGLTDMLVTDLSQSADLEVLGTDRLVQILQELKRADDAVISADVVQEVARARRRREGRWSGSYVRAGGTHPDQRPAAGRADRPHRDGRTRGGPGEIGLFSLVDELTRRFKAHMAAAGRRRPRTAAQRGRAAKPDDADWTAG